VAAQIGGIARFAGWNAWSRSVKGTVGVLRSWLLTRHCSPLTGKPARRVLLRPRFTPGRCGAGSKCWPTTWWTSPGVGMWRSAGRVPIGTAGCLVTVGRW